MARLDQGRQLDLEPNRIQFAIEQIESLGYIIIFQSSREIQFKFQGKLIKYYPYSGWATGVTIKDGRGLINLLKQI